MDELSRLARACVIPGFEGTELPHWVRGRLDDGLGGVVLYARNVSSASQLARLTSAIRDARPQSLIAIDEEGGDVTRLEATGGSSYPGSLALGRADDVGLTQAVAGSMGRDLVAAGINLDLAPVADVNSNPDNPVIGVRSFGERPDAVAAHVAAFVRGLQREGVAACAKHFPGHGDTSVDSHLALPTIDKDAAELRAAALVPFRAAIAAGIQAIMTAHIVVPALDAVPATLSRRIVTDLLRRELGFGGLVVTDALEMQAIRGTVGVETGGVMALKAGADALCIGHDLADDDMVMRLERAIVAAVRQGQLEEERLAEAAARIEQVVEWARARQARTAETSRELGLQAARRAIRVEGNVRLAAAPMVVELRPEPSPPTRGVAWGLADVVASRDPGSFGVSLAGTPVDVDGLIEIARGRSLVVVVRDLHRHAWVRAAVESLVRRRPDTVLVEMGLPKFRPAGAAAYIATYGAAKVNAIAAVETMLPPPTERPHRRSADLDGIGTLGLLQLMHGEDERAVEAVGSKLSGIARAVDGIADRLRDGGALHYFGAGTSGRLAALDALECPATFGIPGDTVVAHVAGEDAAEDDAVLGLEDARAAKLGRADAIVGVSASGRTPYVIAALDHARQLGAFTVAVTCAPGSALGRAADVGIELDTGPELIAGSTRLKAGTAQKVVLNMISTGVFSRLGHVYRGRMVDMIPGNEKLRQRAAQMVRELTGATSGEVDRALAETGGNAKLAILMLQAGIDAGAARARLAEVAGDLSLALGEP